MDLLSQARITIDDIDKEMAELFAKRMDAVCDVIAHKIEHNLPILDSRREAEVVTKNLALLPQGNEKVAMYYEDFIKHNMELSRAYQSEILGSNTVAYQGVPGAFSHIVAKRVFPYAKENSYATWKEVFEAVCSGNASFGVLPFENSNAGDVSEVLDLCFMHPQIYVSQVYDLRVQQNILAVHGATLADVKTVVSHPQALAQSARFVSMIGVDKVEYPNTAAAAEYVAKTQDKSIAAIASVETAELYDLEVLAEDISENKENTTRFVVISKKEPSLGNRFSLLFTVSHTAGSLAKVIAIIGECGYNMESIKSRPMPQVSWEYYFYTELVGTAEDAKNLQVALQETCQNVRILGVYNR